MFAHKQMLQKSVNVQPKFKANFVTPQHKKYLSDILRIC